ncbi:hypothetical protein [Streptomyces sp. NBC_01794]|uniref:hypothetical protein n=1 Tax=Streptomyces sp. NBC_01794 TaxID=2975942 RepID=UPI00308A0697|nr:hypothetical protein OIE54_12320 [Streptomyces sp. NBC_01794]
MPTGADHDYARLAKLAKQRRHELSLALNDKNAKAAGTSKGTWQRVEKGEPIRSTNYVKIDGLLKWAPGSCLAALEGREPIPSRPAKDAANADISERPVQDIDATARDVIRLAMIATTSGLTSEEIRDLSDRAVRDLKDAGLI